MPRARVTTDERTGARWYPYPPVEDLLLTSVTTITGGTQDKPWLSDWQAGMGAKFAVDNLRLIQAVAAGEAWTVKDRETGPDAAIKLITDTSERLRDIKSRAGVYVHDVLERLILWADLPGHRGDLIDIPPIPLDLVYAKYDGDPLPEVVDAMVDGFVQFVCDWDPEFLHSEMTVYHVAMGVAGTLDIICRIKDAAVVQQGKYMALVRRKGSTVTICLDAKTGKILDAPMEEQVCTYPRMTEANMGLGQLRPMPHTDYPGILHLRKDFVNGYRVKLVPVERSVAAWNRFRKAAQIFMEREQIKHVGQVVFAPTATEGELPEVLIGDLEGYPRVPSALVKAGFRNLSELTVFTADDLLGVKAEGRGKNRTPGKPGVKGIGDKSLPVIRQMLADFELFLAGESPEDQARPVEVAA